MMKLRLVFFGLIISANIFGQSAELPESLKTLKKNLQEYAISSPSNNDTTRFKAKKFDDCSVSYYYITNESNPETMVEFQPILSNTGTFNRSPDNSKNAVYVKSQANDGTVERNDKLKRTNEVNNSDNNGVKDISRDIKVFNFAYVVPDSIIVSNEISKNRYSLTFAIKEVTSEYKIEEQRTIYLKAKNQETLDEVTKNFKHVVSLCQAK